MLEARDLTIPEEAHQRITACTDPAQLLRWITRAVIVGTVDEIFD